jgi:pectate lyase
METVKDAANKTVYGLPGSVLQNSIHSAVVAQSGVLSFNRCKNIILRNLTFKSAGAYDIDGNDNLQFQSSDYIWVDHCDFFDGVDGNFDCNNGSDHISITWCRFRYLIKPYAGGSGGSDDHRNCCLWGGSDNNEKDRGHLRTTFANCWWDQGCHERMPRVRFGQVHIVNCLYSCSGNGYCIGAAYASNIYAEKNVFSGVNYPWKCYAEKSGKTDYNITMTGNSGASDEQKHSGSIAFFNPYSVYSYTAMDVNKVQSEVSGHAGATLKITEGSTVSAAKLSSIGNFDDSTTGIGEAANSSENVSVKYYNINGTEIPQLQHGFNIVKTIKADGQVEVKKVSIK